MESCVGMACHKRRGICRFEGTGSVSYTHLVDGIGCEKTLTLVTCSYEWKQARNILVAVKTGA